MTTLKTSPKLKVLIVGLKRQLDYHYKNWKQEIGSWAAVLIRLAKPASSNCQNNPFSSSFRPLRRSSNYTCTCEIRRQEKVIVPSALMCSGKSFLINHDAFVLLTHVTPPSERYTPPIREKQTQEQIKSRLISPSPKHRGGTAVAHALGGILEVNMLSGKYAVGFFGAEAC